MLPRSTLAATLTEPLRLACAYCAGRRTRNCALQGSRSSRALKCSGTVIGGKMCLFRQIVVDDEIPRTYRFTLSGNRSTTCHESTVSRRVSMDSFGGGGRTRTFCWAHGSDSVRRRETSWLAKGALLRGAAPEERRDGPRVVARRSGLLQRSSARRNAVVECVSAFSRDAVPTALDLGRGSPGRPTEPAKGDGLLDACLSNLMAGVCIGADGRSGDPWGMALPSPDPGTSTSGSAFSLGRGMRAVGRIGRPL